MNEFDDIRPYDDAELPQIYEELIGDPAFRKIVSSVIPHVPFDMVVHGMRQCRTKLDFQKAFIYGFLKKIAQDTTAEVSLDLGALGGTDAQSRSYTYISNHRDIILDSGFLSLLLVEHGMDTVEIAIGDNLLIYPWIKKLVRINKSFIVQRALSMRQMLESSERMSRYIHYTITSKHQSVWIAQREGRAKDSDDRTQESVLKMFAMSGSGDVIDRLVELNIAPLSISYEYDPCDYLKAQEFQLKRDVLGYKKTTADDLLNMQTGLFGKKGRVRFKVAPCINEGLLNIDRGLPRQELFTAVASLIDRSIHANYSLFPCNYVAHDLLYGEHLFSEHYTKADCRSFEEYLAQQVERVTLPTRDDSFIYEKLLLMYANPLTNYLKAQE